MLDFYLEVLFRKWFEGVRQLLTKWRFWLWFVPIVGAYFVPDRYWQFYVSVQNGLPSWVLPWLFVGVGFYVFLKVVHAEVEEARRELKQLKDKQAQSESTAQLQRVKLIEALRRLESAGIRLRKDILKTYQRDKHKPRHDAWQEEILAILRKDAPQYENEMLLAPQGRTQLIHGNDRDFALRDMDEWLEKLHAVIGAIERS